MAIEDLKHGVISVGVDDPFEVSATKVVEQEENTTTTSKPLTIEHWSPVEQCHVFTISITQEHLDSGALGWLERLMSWIRTDQHGNDVELSILPDGVELICNTQGHEPGETREWYQRLAECAHEGWLEKPKGHMNTKRPKMLAHWMQSESPDQWVPDQWDQLCWRIEARMAQNPDTGPTWEGSRLPHWRIQLVSAQPEAYVYRLHYGKGNKAIAKATRALGYLDVLAGDLQNIIRWSEHPYPFAEYAS